MGCQFVLEDGEVATGGGYAVGTLLDQPGGGIEEGVEDIDAAVSRVRQAGGTVIEEPSVQPYGKSALCTDDQGTRFYLGEL